jgi:endonuclease YncB( thermonuclease family)
MLLGLVAMLTALPAEAAKCPRGTLAGEATYVRDGDTIVVGTMPIRLNGLAAPEGDEPGGAAATRAMVDLVQGRKLRCELDGERTHDRCVGVCYLDGQDISEVMVRRGLARDCERFSGGRYGVAERQAAAEGATIRARYPLPGYCMPR